MVHLVAKVLMMALGVTTLVVATVLKTRADLSAVAVLKTRMLMATVLVAVMVLMFRLLLA